MSGEKNNIGKLHSISLETCECPQKRVCIELKEAARIQHKRFQCPVNVPFGCAGMPTAPTAGRVLWIGTEASL